MTRRKQLVFIKTKSKHLRKSFEGLLDIEKTGQLTNNEFMYEELAPEAADIELQHKNGGVQVNINESR